MILVNGESEPFLEETVMELLERRGVGIRGVAVALYGNVIPRSQWSLTVVRDESKVEIVSAAAGG
jgi:sulfur carrier protein